MENTGYVTLEAFAARVECHFTTASRLKAGYRMPGRNLLGRIVRVYFANDPEARDEAYRIFTEGTSEEFGEFLREHIFDVAEENTTEAIHASTGKRVA